MIWKILVNFILILLVSILQISFISNLPAGLNGLNIILLVIVFILMFSNYVLAFWWTIGLSLFFEIYFFLPFGLYSLVLFITLNIIYFLLYNFFTNRSLYSVLALIFFANLIYNILFIIFLYLFHLFFQTDFNITLNFDFISLQLFHLILNLFLAFIIFYIINFISYRWRPVFLVKKI